MIKVAELLKYGKENAIKSSELELLTGRDKRSIQELIEKERDEGALICACTEGYYLAADRQEAFEFYKRHTKRARKMLFTARHFLNPDVEGQISLDEIIEEEQLVV